MIEQDSRLIAEFMGNLRLYQVLLDPNSELKKWRHSDYKNFTYDEAVIELPKIKEEGYPDAEIVYVGGVTKFHSSWDWIMTIVGKINKRKNVGEFLGFEVVIAKDETYITCFYDYSGVHTLSIGNTNSEKYWISKEGDNSLTNTYKAVIEFIKWYNNNI